MKKKKDLFVGVFALLFLVSGCKNQVTLSSTETSDRTSSSSIDTENATEESSIDSQSESTELEEVKQNGFDLGDGYRIFMTDSQKNNPQDLDIFEESNFFEPNFSKAKNRINTQKKK